MLNFCSLGIDWGKVAEIAATSGATLAAAYFGAKFAFDMQTRRERSAQRIQNIQNSNLSVFEIRKCRDLLQALMDATESDNSPFIHNHLLMKPFSTTAFAPPNFNLSALSFLLESSASTLFKAANLQNQVTWTLNVIQQRSEMHHNVVQPAIEKLQNQLKLAEVPDNFQEILAKELGPRIDAVMENLSNQMIEGLRNGIKECADLANEIHKETMKIYPPQEYSLD